MPGVTMNAIFVDEIYLSVRKTYGTLADTCMELFF